MVWHWRMSLVVAGPVLALAVLVGCSGRGNQEQDDPSFPLRSKGPGGAAAQMTPVTAEKTTTLTGTVKLRDANIQDRLRQLTEELEQKMRMKDATVCLGGVGEEVEQNMWRVDKDSRGVKNIFVWLRPVDDRQYFNVEKLVQDKKFTPVVEVDQPHCAFIPHASVLFQRFIKDGNGNFALRADQGGPGATGQKFVVRNSAPILHNIRWKGGNEGLPPNLNRSEPASKVIEIQPSYKEPTELNCDVHPWMRAFVWSFPHPFAAITNEKGEFKIENVPAGIEVRLVVWHERAGFINGGDKGEVVKLKEGSDSKDFEFDFK